MTSEMIKKIRKELLLTTREFAKVLGVTQATISSWENGKYNISIRNERKIRELYKNYKQENEE